MTMDFEFNQVLEHVDLNGMVAGFMDDGVLDGLSVSQKTGFPDMSVDVAIGNCYVGYIKHTKSSITNVGISAAHASYDRKDIIIYDTSVGAPVVVTGTPSGTPEPPDIPYRNIILAMLDVEAGSLQITNGDITDKRIVINRILEYVELQNMVRAVKYWAVVSGLATTENGTPNMSVDVSSGSCQIDEIVYTESGITNVTITASDSTYDRRDIIIYDKSAGNPVVIDGIISAHPVAPNLPDDDILLGIVNVPANVNTIVNAYITDKRIISSILNSVSYINSGTYTGDNSDNRAITHGLGRIPKFVILHRTGEYRSIIEGNYINFTDDLISRRYTVTDWTNTYFYVGDNMSYQNSSNDSGSTYYWVAFG